MSFDKGARETSPTSEKQKPKIADTAGPNQSAFDSSSLQNGLTVNNPMAHSNGSAETVLGNFELVAQAGSARRDKRAGHTGEKGEKKTPGPENSSSDSARGLRQAELRKQSEQRQKEHDLLEAAIDKKITDRSVQDHLKEVIFYFEATPDINDGQKAATLKQMRRLVPDKTDGQSDKSRIDLLSTTLEALTKRPVIFPEMKTKSGDEAMQQFLAKHNCSLIAKMTVDFALDAPGAAITDVLKTYQADFDQMLKDKFQPDHSLDGTAPEERLKQSQLVLQQAMKDTAPDKKVVEDMTFHMKRIEARTDMSCEQKADVYRNLYKILTEGQVQSSETRQGLACGLMKKLGLPYMGAGNRTQDMQALLAMYHPQALTQLYVEATAQPASGSAITYLSVELSRLSRVMEEGISLEAQKRIAAAR